MSVYILSNASDIGSTWLLYNLIMCSWRIINTINKTDCITQNKRVSSLHQHYTFLSLIEKNTFWHQSKYHNIKIRVALHTYNTGLSGYTLTDLFHACRTLSYKLTDLFNACRTLLHSSMYIIQDTVTLYTFWFNCLLVVDKDTLPLQSWNIYIR